MAKWLFLEGVPALCDHLDLFACPGDQVHPFFGLRHVANHGKIGISLDFVIILLADREKKLVVLASTQGNCSAVQVELLTGRDHLLIQRYFVLIDVASHLGFLAEMQYFRRQPVGDVDHRSRKKLKIPEKAHNILSRFRFELPFDQVGIIVQLVLGMGVDLKYLALSLKDLQKI